MAVGVSSGMDSDSECLRVKVAFDHLGRRGGRNLGSESRLVGVLGDQGTAAAPTLFASFGKKADRTYLCLIGRKCLC